MENKIIAFVGQLGAGKTLAMTYMTINNHLILGKTIYSNYHLKRVPYIPVTSLSQIDEMRDGIFSADELWSWVDSRTTRSKSNRMISKIALVARKRGVDILYTAQNFHQMEKRIRDITNIVIKPVLNGPNTICTMLLYDRLEIDDQRPKPFKILKFYAPAIFNLYDTREEIGDLDED